MKFDTGNITHYIFAIAVVMAARYVGNLYMQVSTEDDPIAKARLLFGSHERDNHDTRKVLPKLWMYVHHAKNARVWNSFGSPNSYDVNQPYMNLCISTTVNYCGVDFDIIMVDDTSFAKMIPDWKYGDLKTELQPRGDRLREIGLATLVLLYGGIVIPDTFVCARNLIDMYNDSIAQNDMFISLDPVAASARREPDAYVFGAPKSSPVIQAYIDFLYKGVVDDVARSTYEQRRRLWLWISAYQKNGKLDISPVFGVTDTRGRVITTERLFEDIEIDLPLNNCGLIIPSNEILARRKYNWFAYLSEDDVLKARIFISRYIARITYDQRFKE